MRIMYFISKEIKNNNIYRCPVFAITDTSEKAINFCQNEINEIRWRYEQTNTFKYLETNDIWKYSCEYDNQKQVTFEIGEMLMDKQEWEQWFNDTTAGYYII